MAVPGRNSGAHEVNGLASSFSRALLYCLHPRVIVLSLLPLLATAGVAAILAYLFWTNAVAGVGAMLDGWVLVQAVLSWLDSIGIHGLHAMLAPLVVLALALPVLVIFCLLLVSVMMTPAIVALVARRRFPQLEMRHGGSLAQSIFYSTGSTLVALVALVLSMPLWLVPPMVLVLPPLIWGWLTYRVMSFDALAEHASADERRALMRRHRLSLLAIGVICGYMGAAPALVWTVGIVSLAFAPLLVLVSVWLYTLVFAFSALWFAHYLLAALEQLRAASQDGAPPRGHNGEPPPQLPPGSTQPPSRQPLPWTSD